MPYIPTEVVKEKRKALRKMFPDWKLSVRTIHHSKISVTLVSGPIDIKFDESDWKDGYAQVNHFYIKEWYENQPELRDVLLKIKNFIGNEQRELVYDGDYGSVPTYYISLNIGDWDKPYVFKPKK